ncbi:unnamed protein product [Prunus armeniaca]|uniref:Uncharacterized protein n=1 Tax=Prunus armeniaca TaxID=36596 RepID=A0A6J5WKH7_PRUAR|nr:unnamed protein product [Prunus armeniaca]
MVDVGQESMPVDLNVSTQVVLEDNHDSENDSGNKEFKDSESEVENNRTKLDKLHCENMQCEDLAYVEADNIFQIMLNSMNVCGDNNMGCNDVPAISVQFDEPNSDKPNSLEYSRMKILQKGFCDFQGEAAKMDSHDMVAEIAMKWTKVLRTGALGVRFMGVDLNTIMFNMEQGQDMTERPMNKDRRSSFSKTWRSSIGGVVEKLQNEKKRVENESPAESNTHLKEEL